MFRKKGKYQGEVERAVTAESSGRAFPPSSSVGSAGTAMYATSEVERNILLNGPFSSTYANCIVAECASCHGSIASEDQAVVDDWRIYQHYGAYN